MSGGHTSAAGWQLSAGALPTGVTFIGGFISGTPAAGTSGSSPHAFTAEATGSTGTASQSYTLIVAPQASGCALVPPATPSAAAFSLPGGTVGQPLPYGQTLSWTSACGTVGPGAFSLPSGSLPPGLTLYSDGGIRGFPTTAGTYTFTVSLVASSGSASQAYSITISP